MRKVDANGTMACLCDEGSYLAESSAGYVCVPCISLLKASTSLLFSSKVENVNGQYRQRCVVRPDANELQLDGMVCGMDGANQPAGEAQVVDKATSNPLYPNYSLACTCDEGYEWRRDFVPSRCVYKCGNPLQSNWNPQTGACTCKAEAFPAGAALYGYYARYIELPLKPQFVCVNPPPHPTPGCLYAVVPDPRMTDAYQLDTAACASCSPGYFYCGGTCHKEEVTLPNGQYTCKDGGIVAISCATGMLPLRLGPQQWTCTTKLQVESNPSFMPCTFQGKEGFALKVEPTGPPQKGTWDYCEFDWTATVTTTATTKCPEYEIPCDARCVHQYEGSPNGFIKACTTAGEYIFDSPPQCVTSPDKATTHRMIRTTNHPEARPGPCELVPLPLDTSIYKQCQASTSKRLREDGAMVSQMQYPSDTFYSTSNLGLDPCPQPYIRDWCYLDNQQIYGACMCNGATAFNALTQAYSCHASAAPEIRTCSAAETDFLTDTEFCGTQCANITSFRTDVPYCGSASGTSKLEVYNPCAPRDARCTCKASADGQTYTMKSTLVNGLRVYQGCTV